MAALDTNVLVRLLVQDDAAQSAIVRRLLSASMIEGGRLFVPVTVMLELEWVLRSRYRFEKTEVIAAMDRLMETVELDFESESALSRALVDCEENGADFADGLHIALAAQAGHSPLWTFDKGAAKLMGASAL